MDVIVTSKEEILASCRRKINEMLAAKQTERARGALSIYDLLISLPETTHYTTEAVTYAGPLPSTATSKR